jgi:hypothetical protein
MDNGKKLLFDVKTMLGNSRTVSYINSDDEKTLNYVKEIYNLIKQQNYINDKL